MCQRVDKDQLSHLTAPQPGFLVEGALQEWSRQPSSHTPLCPQSPPGFNPLPLALPWARGSGGNISHLGHWLPSLQGPPTTDLLFLAATSHVGSPGLPTKASRPPGVFPPLLLCLFFSLLIPSPLSEVVYLYLIIDFHIYPANILSSQLRAVFPACPPVPGGALDLSGGPDCGVLSGSGYVPKGH